jgi:hypothetical protein
MARVAHLQSAAGNGTDGGTAFTVTLPLAAG